MSGFCDQALERLEKEAAAAKEAREKAELEAVKMASKRDRDHDRSLKELHAKLAAAQEELRQEKRKAETAGQGTEQLRAELEEARKQLKASDSDVTAFGIRFNSIQTEWGFMTTELKKVQLRDQETAEKLKTAIRQMLDYFRKELEEEHV